MSPQEKNEKLSRLLNAVTVEKAPAEVLYEIMHAQADVHAEIAEEYRLDAPAQYVAMRRSISGMRNAALSMVNLFGGHQANAAWLEERACLPWWKRMWVGTSATQEFRSQWSAEMRAYGRDLVAEALA